MSAMGLSSGFVRVTAVLTAVALMSGCSWRLESDTPTYPSPDATTLERDAAADLEQAILDATTSDADDSTSGTVLRAQEEASAPVRLDALGGVYEAYPDVTPTPDGTAAPAPGLVASIIEARDSHFTVAMSTSDRNMAGVLLSAGLSHALTLWYAAWVDQVVTGAEAVVSAERVLDTPALDGETLVPAATQLDPAVVSQLALTHDRAGYLYEVLGARSTDTEREQWLTRSALQRARAAALLTLPGTEDLRESVYVTPTRDIADAAARVSVAQAHESMIGDTYATLVSDAATGDVAWILSAAFDAYAQAAAYGDATADSAVIPALPGLEPLPSPSSDSEA